MKVKLIGGGNKTIAEFEMTGDDVGDLGVVKLGEDYFTYASMATGGDVRFERVNMRELKIEDAISGGKSQQ